MSMYGQRTPGDYAFGEVVSALQKAIRAGDARQAAHWAMEIEACGPNARKHLWNRLKVIVSEDIGPTNEGNAVAVLVGVLAHNYFDAWRRKNDSYRLFLMHAIIAMVSASKTRICDDMAICVYQQSEPLDIGGIEELADSYAQVSGDQDYSICQDIESCVGRNPDRYDIPDNALDKHTARGRRMGRGIEHWLQHGIAVTPVNTDLEPLASSLKEEARQYLLEGRPWRYATDDSRRIGNGKSRTGQPQPLL